MTPMKLIKSLMLLPVGLALGLAACAPATLAPTLTPPPAQTQPPAAVQPTAAARPRASGSAIFPDDHVIADWNITLLAQAYTHDNLFELVDGQADAFFAYNFEQVTTQRYQNTDGTLLNIEVWQLAQPGDAYGLFTQSRAGTPVKMGNEGDSDPGRRLAFWQDRYYVHVNANKAVPDIQLMAFADYVSVALPKGGEPPALVNSLPPQGLTERGYIYFHEELSVQGEVWLGGENILGLSPTTNGVVARYTLDGTPAHLLIIQYPDADQASTALQALRKAKDLDLITADAKGPILSAVFGKAGEAAATPLLQAALTGVKP
jgi:hypothetical protein